MGRIRQGVVAVVACALGALVVPAVRADVPGPCAWPVEDSPASVGYMWPDLQAHYWMLNLPVVPGTRIVAHGSFPEARYMSLVAYDEGLKALGRLTDAEITPDGGARNPFGEGGASSRDATWTAVFAADPGVATGPNDVYVGRDAREQKANGAVTFLYRIYVPDDEANRTGGAPLPEIRLEGPDGSRRVEFTDCGTYPGLGGPLTDEVAESDTPAGVAAPGADPRATRPPAWRVGAGFLSVLPSQVAGTPVGAEATYRTSDLGTNPDWGYVNTFLSPGAGEVVVIRGKAPSFPDTRAGQPVWKAAQTRYWSFCVNHLFSLRTMSCASDFQTPLDEEGRYVLVVSSPSRRPANAVASGGVTWLSTGPVNDVYVDYRQGLPAESFAYAVQRARPGDHLPTVLGDYHPDITYCRTATFESGGADACFAVPAT